MPGTEPPRVKAIDDAGWNYYEVMMERVELSKQEDEKKTALIEKMKEHGVDRYETANGLVITVTAKSNVSCKKKKEAKADPESNGQE